MFSFYTYQPQENIENKLYTFLEALEMKSKETKNQNSLIEKNTMPTDCPFCLLENNPGRNFLNTTTCKEQPCYIKKIPKELRIKKGEKGPTL